MRREHLFWGCILLVAKSPPSQGWDCAQRIALLRLVYLCLAFLPGVAQPIYFSGLLPVA